MGDKAAVLTGALDWAGTFHGVGARLLRELAGQIGLDPAFTIHDREDAADLMNLVRHELGFSKMESRFPTKGTCLAIYSRTVNAEAELDAVLQKAFPWCASWEKELKLLFAAYVEAKQRQNVLDYDDLLLYWAAMLEVEAIAAPDGDTFVLAGTKRFVMEAAGADEIAVVVRLAGSTGDAGKRGITSAGDIHDDLATRYPGRANAKTPAKSP